MESTVEYFIENVRINPCLWNQSHVAYRDGIKKDNAWEAVARVCGLSCGREAKAQWKKLRDSHREAMRRRKPEAGPSAQYLGKWKYEEDMKFLLDQSESKEIFNPNDSYDDSSKNSMEINNTTIKLPVMTDRSDTMSNDDPVSTEPNRKRKMNMSFIYEEKEQPPQEERERRRDDLLKQLVQVSHRGDAISKFFDSMCDKTRDLPKYLQLRVEREVFNSVSKAEEEALSLNPGMNELNIITKMSPKGYEASNAILGSYYDGNSDYHTKFDRKSTDSNDSKH